MSVAWLMGGVIRASPFGRVPGLNDHFTSGSLSRWCNRSFKVRLPFLAGSLSWAQSSEDRLERRLHVPVCIDRALTLHDAQEAIARDWIAAHTKYIGER
jgi:hypothetical protein